MSQSTPYRITTTGSSGGGCDGDISFAQRVNIDVTTNLNGTNVVVPVDGALTNNGSGWSINGNGIELTGPDSYVRCSCSIHVSSSNARTNLRIQFARNGVLFGPIAAHGYIRRASGHNESSYNLGPTWTKMAQGDIITIVSNQEGNGGSQVMAVAGTSQLLLERHVNV